MAVGSATGGASPAGITEHWDGASWSMRAVPDPAGKDLTGVSCSSPVACIAVGSLGGVPLAERWDGTRWTATPTGDSGSGSLDAVSCTADGHCLAVGQGRSGGALAEAWDGTSWAPASPTDAATGVDGVSCTSAESCTAVGAAGPSTVAEHWNGSGWTSEPTVGGAGRRFEPARIDLLPLERGFHGRPGGRRHAPDPQPLKEREGALAVDRPRPRVA
jgi:hypothetical protein